MQSQESNELPAAEEPLSVSAAMARAKGALESFVVTLIGEVSEVNNKPGYKAVYFSVKDSQASLPCMMWLNRYQSAGIDMQVGMLVELTGRFTVYAPKGRMNFDVFSLAVAGEGDLRMKVAKLAEKLKAEGLMRPEKKRRIPSFPQTIGLVTSPRGAAVHDVLRTLRRRFPVAKVLVAGVAVEGEKAPEGLVRAMHCVQDAGAEVVLLVRGGGSFEDLMPFNDESLARAIAALEIPVVTGIGHEPDTSIADMVADCRASTPTAAAEAVSPAPEVLEAMLTARITGMRTALSRRLERHTLQIERLAGSQLFSDANRLFAIEAQTLDLLEERLRRAIPLNIERDRMKVDRYAERLLADGASLLTRFGSALSLRAARLHDLSPLAVLARGYSITKDERGQIVKSVAQVDCGKAVTVDVADGRLVCTVEKTERTTALADEENL